MKRSQRLAILGIAMAVVAGFAALQPSRLTAQATYGSIMGTVTDASGAVVPGATLTVINMGTDEARVAKSDASGNYSVVNLLPATYKVTVDAPNFKHFIRQPIPVAVGATVRIDPALQIGAASETVEVTTQPPLLQTDSSSINQGVEGQTVQEMPLNGRNAMNLIALAAGVVPGGSTAGSAGGNQGAGHTNTAGFGNYQIGGSLPGAAGMYVDGMPVNIGGSLAGNVVGLIPTQDAVQEFNVSSNNVSAEFGRFGGGVINMASKGGTNRITGSFYEYFRNSFLNANEWFHKANQLAAGKPNKPLQWNQNQYGLSVGGPIRKDKLFYHFTWEGFKSDTAQTANTNVPTTAMQNGIISEHYKSGVLQSFQDPLGYCTITHQPGSSSAPGTWTITNLWSVNCGDPMAKVMRTYYPSPNNSNAIGSSQGNYTASPATPTKQQQYNARVDYNLSSRQRLFARYSYWSLEDVGYDELGSYGGWKTANAYDSNYTTQFVIGDTFTFSPKTVLDVRLAYLRDYVPGSIPASLGMKQNIYPSNSYVNLLSSSLTAHELVQYAVSGSSSYNLYSLSHCCMIAIDWFNNYSISASLIRILGNHSLKFGFLATRYGDISSAAGNSGSFSFNGQYTGDEWADFLLGYETNSSSLSTQNEAYFYNYYQGYYVTDAWRATRKLTLNLGLRWELPGAILSGQDNNTVLLPNATDPTYNVTGTLALVNSSLYGSKSSFNVKHDLFAPRVGFAYRMDNNTVVSGGFGITYLPIDVLITAMPVKSPINQNPNSCGIVYNATSAPAPNPNMLMYNCFSTSYNPIVAPPERSSGYFALLQYYENTGKSMTGADPFQKYPYNEQWNFSVARQLPGSTMFELSYVGAGGIHVPASGNDLNQLPDSALSKGAGLLANGTCGTTRTLTVGQCLRPYPHYGIVSNSAPYNTQTIYHSMQLKGEKRLGASGTLMGNFTWAKMIGNTDTRLGFLEAGTGGPNTNGGGAPSYQDYTNLRAERSVLSYDVPFRAVFNYILSLPFGTGQKYLNNAHGALGHVVSGWGVSGITTFQHGFHLPIRDTVITSGASQNNQLGSTFGAGSIRPNYTAGCSKGTTLSGNARVAKWFNTSCWTQPAPWTFGNEPRVENNMFMQGMNNFDFSLLKSTAVTERMKVQFRAEFFNIFNRKQFAQPDASLGDSTFGQVSATNNQPRLVQFNLRVNF